MELLKPFGSPTPSSGAPRFVAHGHAMIARTPLRTNRRLPRHYVRRPTSSRRIAACRRPAAVGQLRTWTPQARNGSIRPRTDLADRAIIACCCEKGTSFGSNTRSRGSLLPTRTPSISSGRPTRGVAIPSFKHPALPLTRCHSPRNASDYSHSGA